MHKKLYNQKRKTVHGEPFAKIDNDHLNINVYASRLFGLDAKRCDIFVDDKNNEVMIVENNIDGQYSINPNKNLDSRRICFKGYLSRNKDIDTNQRYLVSKCDEGIKFKFERIEQRKE